jgi:hypothetical protein
LRAATEALRSAATDAVEIEELCSDLEPTSSKTGLAWLRWRLSKEPGFIGEKNMLQTRIYERDHLCEFLPKAKLSARPLRLTRL